jgi:hypothetical protein
MMTLHTLPLVLHQSETDCFFGLGSLPPSLASREISSSLRIFRPHHPFPQHYILFLWQCEFHHHLSSYPGTHKIYVRFFQRQSILLHRLCLFLFLWLEEKYFYRHTTLSVSFLLSHVEFEVSFPLYISESCLGQLFCHSLDFFLGLFDLVFSSISL